MAESFEVAVEGGTLACGREGSGERDALLLHGGPGLSDYLDGLPEELDGVLRTTRYQQRGTAPSTALPGGGVEAHVADALAVLDACEIDRVWLVGHSWGGHLAMHVAVAAPERVAGLVVVDPLGAVPDGGAAELDANLTARLSGDAKTAAEALDARLTAGQGDEADGIEMLRLVWPFYFADADSAPPMPRFRVSADVYADTWASINAHFDRRTLVHGLPRLRCPTVFVHGRESPIPWRRSEDSAALIPGARLAVIAGCGHFPWIERPGSIRSALLELMV
jgi:pimeloyl-ACP methyl ester carboxylesterase